MKGDRVGAALCTGEFHPDEILKQRTKLEREGKMVITVTLNGTSENPYHKLGMRRNPFPQIARAEFNAADRMLAQLDAEPLNGPEDIRRILAGCDADFIELCCKQFKKGERVRFLVYWPKEAAPI
jgi:hypothetical protein